MNAPVLPGTGPLTPEQLRLLDQLVALVDANQSTWISGYFAGFATGLTHAGPQIAAGATGQRRLLILYGSETGNCADIARGLHETATEKGLSPALMDMGDYKHRQLAHEQDIIFVVSTYGEGDPPQPATGFFDFIEGRKAPSLGGMRFAVLALGDTSYDRFCEAGKRLDRRCEELGAARLLDRADCDVDFEENAAVWCSAVLEKLLEARSAPVAASPGSLLESSASSVARYDKKRPFPAIVLENISLVGRGSSKETRHIELSLDGSGLVYEPGDALGVVAQNDADVVLSLLRALGLSADTLVAHKNSTLSFGEVLCERFEVTTATPRFLEFWAQKSGADFLSALLAEERQGERNAFLHTHHIVDIVTRFPVAEIDAQSLLAGLRPLQPRLYSLASSLAYAPGEAHLTIAPVRYNLNGTERVGVATSQLTARSPVDASVSVFVQSNAHFRLPADGVPIVMVGAGTGVAPFRAFMQEREARGAKGKSWLLFGERQFRTDFLYQTEWQRFLKDGVLTRMDVAFSRDNAEKVYVQHRMREQARRLYEWLEEGAHFYVCGDATHLAPDVHEMLIQIISEQGRIGRESAEDYVRSLIADHRYQRDVY